jgi:hypothetical protein
VRGYVSHRALGTNIVFGDADRNPPVDDCTENDRKDDCADDEPVAFAWSCESFVLKPRFVNSDDSS